MIGDVGNFHFQWIIEKPMSATYICNIRAKNSYLFGQKKQMAGTYLKYQNKWLLLVWATYMKSHPVQASASVMCLVKELWCAPSKAFHFKSEKVATSMLQMMNAEENVSPINLNSLDGQILSRQNIPKTCTIITKGSFHEKSSWTLSPLIPAQMTCMDAE